MAKINEVRKNVVETMADLKNIKNMNLGIDFVEMPDGTKLQFAYNGEEDRAQAIQFAQICYNATGETRACMDMMQTCYFLMARGIEPTEIVTLDDGQVTFYDSTKRGLYNKAGLLVIEATDEEKELQGDDKLFINLLKERANEAIARCDYDEDYDEDDDCDYDY